MTFDQSSSVPLRYLFEKVVPGVTVGWGLIESLQFPLHSEEAAFINHAVDKRQREFTAARALARQLFTVANDGQLSAHRDWPLINGDDRAPHWPAGICGSISHTDASCGVAIATTSTAISVGLDIEALGRLKHSLWKQLFTAREIELLRELSPSDQDVAATSIFSAKESFYKYQYPLTGKWVGFRDAEVTLLKGNRFNVSLVTEIAGVPTPVMGHLAHPDCNTVAALTAASVVGTSG